MQGHRTGCWDQPDVLGEHLSDHSQSQRLPEILTVAERVACCWNRNGEQCSLPNCLLLDVVSIDCKGCVFALIGL